MLAFAVLQDTEQLSRCSDNYSDLYICHCNMVRIDKLTVKDWGKSRKNRLNICGDANKMLIEKLQ